MATALQNLSDYDADNLPDATDLSVGIIVSDWNKEITHALYEGCYSALTDNGVAVDNIHTMQVPGTFELPAGARMLSGRENLDAVVCLGCVIKGETKHDEYINQAVSNGLINLSIATGKPHIFGVLTPNNMEQARERAGGRHGNKGVEAAITAIRMGHLYHQGGGKKSIGFGR